MSLMADEIIDKIESNIDKWKKDREDPSKAAMDRFTFEGMCFRRLEATAMSIGINEKQRVRINELRKRMMEAAEIPSEEFPRL